MNTFTDELAEIPAMQDDLIETRRETFRQANASLALEGLLPNDEQLVMQEKIIQGRLTTEQAIAQIIAKYAG